MNCEAVIESKSERNNTNRPCQTKVEKVIFLRPILRAIDGCDGVMGTSFKNLQYRLKHNTDYVFITGGEI